MEFLVACVDAQSRGDLHDSFTGRGSRRGNKATRFRVLRSFRRGDRGLKIKLQINGALQRGGKKKNSVQLVSRKSTAWRLIARLACLLALRVAPAMAQHEAHEGHHAVGWLQQARP